MWDRDTAVGSCVQGLQTERAATQRDGALVRWKLQRYHSLQKQQLRKSGENYLVRTQRPGKRLNKHHLWRNREFALVPPLVSVRHQARRQHSVANVEGVDERHLQAAEALLVPVGLQSKLWSGYWRMFAPIAT